MIANATIGPLDDEAITMLDGAGYEGFEARQWAKSAPEAALVLVLESDCKASNRSEYAEWLLLAVAAHEELFKRLGSNPMCDNGAQLLH